MSTDKVDVPVVAGESKVVSTATGDAKSTVAEKKISVADSVAIVADSVAAMAEKVQEVSEAVIDLKSIMAAFIQQSAVNLQNNQSNVVSLEAHMAEQVRNSTAVAPEEAAAAKREALASSEQQILLDDIKIARVDVIADTSIESMRVVALAVSEQTSRFPIETADNVDAEIADATGFVAKRSGPDQAKTTSKAMSAFVIDADLVFAAHQRLIVVVSSSRIWDPGGRSTSLSQRTRSLSAQEE